MGTRFIKILHGKVVEHWTSYKKVCGCICLSTLQWRGGLQRLCLKYHNVILFETYQSIESSGSTPGEDWYVHPLAFL